MTDAIMSQTAARFAGHQCHRAGQGRARLAADRRRHLAGAWHRLGLQLSRRPVVSGAGPCQQQRKKLQIEDGWIYFIHGWTRVIAEVFHIDIPTSGPGFDELSRIAADVR